MSVINREDAIAKIKDIPYVQEHPNIGLLFEEWLNLMPDAEPTVFDGFFLCDKSQERALHGKAKDGRNA